MSRCRCSNECKDQISNIILCRCCDAYYCVDCIIYHLTECNCKTPENDCRSITKNDLIDKVNELIDRYTDMKKTLTNKTAPVQYIPKKT